MKILSKIKDYYDYLSGIYGEDPLKVLDRRDINPSKDINEILFCGKIYIKGKPEYVRKGWGGTVRYGESDKKYFISDFNNIEVIYQDEEVVWFTLSWENYIRRWGQYKEYLVDENKPYHTLSKHHRYPILKNIGFEKVMDVQECYLAIESYISKQDAEVPSDPTDMNRYEGKGFDKKTSFRK